MRRLALALPVVMAACVNGTVPQTSFPPLGSSGDTATDPRNTGQGSYSYASPAAARPSAPVGLSGPNVINVNGKPYETDPSLRVVNEATRKSIDMRSLRQAAQRSFGRGQKRDDQVIQVGDLPMNMRVVKSGARGVEYTFAVVRAQPKLWRGPIYYKDRTGEVYDAVRRATGCAGSNNGWTRRWSDSRPNEYTVHLVCT